MKTKFVPDGLRNLSESNCLLEIHYRDASSILRNFEQFCSSFCVKHKGHQEFGKGFEKIIITTLR